MSATQPRPGEMIIDSQKAAEMVAQNRRLYSAVMDLARVTDIAADLEALARNAAAALAKEPEYDAIPDFVRVDASWADELPKCIECGRDVPWAEAVLMPCSTIEDGDIDTLGIIHGDGGCGGMGA